MNWIESLILGIIQGLAEFLPISSSGHLEIGKILLGVDMSESLTFTVVVHGATVLSTIVVFWKDIISLFTGLFAFRWNEETKYVTKIIISMIPVGIVGVLWKDEVESMFNGDLLFVGSMLIVTALLLGFAHYSKNRNRSIGFADALIIGIAQAIAVIPGISRSGATIATSLSIGNKRDEAARFSFLMVLVPVIGANLLNLLDNKASESHTDYFVLAIGFVAAFITGLFACKLMIQFVKKQKLIYFAIYCAIIGSIAVVASLLSF